MGSLQWKGRCNIIIRSFDTESTDLSASWGRILCASFVDMKGEVFTLRGDKRPHDLPPSGHAKHIPGEEIVDDSKLCVAIRDTLEEADIIVGWNSILHDIPLLNARLQVAGERPYKNKLWPNGGHLDFMFYATGTAMKLGSKSLANVSKFYKLENQKTPLDGKTWQRAATGDRAAMNLVVEHCEADTLVLRDTFPYLAPHVSKFVLPFKAWWKFADQIEL